MEAHAATREAGGGGVSVSRSEIPVHSLAQITMQMLRFAPQRGRARLIRKKAI